MNQQEFFSRFTYNVRTDKIGGGGFGTVYKAYDNTLHRDVAVKVSEVKTASNGKTFSLKDEFEALRNIPAHPNIANYEELYSFEMPNGVFDYAVMQYYPDGNLSDLIKAGLDPAQKEDIALQLLDGVGFLHKHNIVHRDLKPGNILIVKHGGKVIPLITDFGLSKAADTVDHSAFSNSFGGGTARYSSPEQLQGLPLRLNTDLWSYGVIVYELFTGNPLFEAGSSATNSAQADMEIYNKIVSGDTHGRLDNVPEKWCNLLERCLVTDPQQRVKSVDELRMILNGNASGPSADSTFVESELQNDKSFMDTTSENVQDKSAGGDSKGTSSKTSGKVERRKPLPWIVGVVAAAAVIAAIVMGVLQNPDTKSYKACQNVEDYRSYIEKYGSNAKHYDEARQYVAAYVADSLAKEEDETYQRCTTIDNCDAYLEKYPEGRYYEEISDKKAVLVKQRDDSIRQRQKEEQASRNKTSNLKDNTKNNENSKYSDSGWCPNCRGKGRVECKACNGTGVDGWSDDACSTCSGRGVILCPSCKGYGK